uniref:Cobaltochelatase n=1 Tax=Methanococcus maripaludis (strain C6 / ATCC BAA-1332) TaxID=444158 RepID=A9A8A0_METM6
MRFKNIFLILLSMLLLSSLTGVSAEEIEYKFISNTTSDESGNFVFDDVQNGNYTLSGVVWSSKGYWLANVQDVTIENGTPVENLTVKVTHDETIDSEAILRLLNRTTISGATSTAMGSKAGVTLVLTDKDGEFISNTTSDESGNFVFDDVQNGNYTLSGVVWSSKGYWLANVQEVTIENGTPLENLTVKVTHDETIDSEAILRLLNRTTISGATSTAMGSKAGVTLVLTDKDGEFISNTTSDESGNFVFDDVQNGNYTLSGVVWSSKGYWLANVQEVTIENGTPLENLTVKVTHDETIDSEAILRLLNRTTISGATSTAMGSKAGVTLVLTDKDGEFISNTTSDESGNFVFDDVQNGNYTLSGVVWSSKGYWLANVQEVTIENGTPLENLTVKVTHDETIDSEAILRLLNRTTISGATSTAMGSKAGVTLVLTKKIIVDTADEETEFVAETWYKFISNTTSDESGNFVFDDVQNGNYTLSGVVWSSKGYWLANVQEVTIENGTPLENLTVKVTHDETIDSEAILRLLNRTTISGATSTAMGSKAGVTLVLTDKDGEFISNTTSDESGNFVFDDVQNGNYTLSGVVWSSKGYWLANVQDVTIENGTPVENLTVKVTHDETIDSEAILRLLNRTTISGATSTAMGSKAGVTLVLTDKDGEFISNTTSDESGNFVFDDVQNGNYTLSGVVWSSKGYWLANVQEVTIENGTPLENLTVKVTHDETIDSEAILRLLNRTTISGATSTAMGSKAGVTLVLTKKMVSYVPGEVSKLNTAIITGYSNYEKQLSISTNRINSNSNLNIVASYYTTSDLSGDIDLSQMDIIYIVMVTQSAETFEDEVQKAIDNGAVVIGSNTYLPESNYSIPEEHADVAEFKKYLSEYWSGGASDDENFDNLIFYLAREYYNRTDLTVKEPTGLQRAIYHPNMTSTVTEFFTGDAEEYFTWYSNRTDGHAFDENAPTVGITFYTSYYPDDMDPINKLIAGFESRGINVIACHGDADNQLDDFLNYNNETKVDAVISFMYRGNYFDLAELGVPVIDGVLNGYMNTSEWVETSNPLPVANMLRIYRPESEGLIDPIMIGATESLFEDNMTISKYIGHDTQIEWLINRTIAQCNLGIEPESEKKVAIIYYNHEGGKNNIGASYLEVAPSIVNLLNAMDSDGYAINESIIPNKTELVDLMLLQGRNIGSWAPGELESIVETGEVELIPEETYISWFNELPEERRSEVVETWGEAPGDLMVYEDTNGSKYIVIPKISMSDNVIVAPQPSRGLMDSYDTLYHDTELPPNHQYIAFYLWLQKEFDADVMVNMGRHGTVEWLPGKEFCLLSDEWPAIMTGDIPVVYPYVMDGTGEGMQAKRRGNAIIIDHLIPPVISAGLYGNYSLLNSEIASYQTSVTESESLKQAQLEEIVNLTVQLDLEDRVNMSLVQNESTIDDFLDELDDVLRDLRTLSMPYGLHVLGEAPEGEELVGMVNSMLGSSYYEKVALYNNSDSAANDLLTKVLLENVTIDNAQMQVLGTTSEDIENDLQLAINYSALLLEADNEIEQVLKAMNGEYIEPGLGGDPILRPETLPSGSNFYSFDEQLVPTKQAWEEGKALVDEWLSEYYNENGEYPTKVAYILWAGESTRHQGIMEAQILYMLGVKPVWDTSSGKVTDVEIINSSELNRPRIDVVVQISGLYRDSFPMKVQLIDKAVRLAYAEDEPENYVRINSNELQDVLNETIKNESLSLDIAQFRIFGPADGNYGTGMANAVSSSETWNDTDALAELYINRMSYIYGQNIWGQTISEYIELQTGQNIEINNTVLFENNLDDIGDIFHSRSSNTYGSLDTNDFFQYVGGLINAITYESGEAPNAYVVNLQIADDQKIETLKNYIENELYARYYNPLWITGMQESGFEGATEMEKFIENLWGWEALTSGLIDDEMWNKAYDTYVADSELNGWLNENNPYAYQSMTARMMETARKDYWNADDAVLENLANEFIQSVVEYGVTCCHHTCGNLELNDWAVAHSSLDEETLKEYEKLYEEATHKDIDVSSETETTVTASSSEPDTYSKVYSGNESVIEALNATNTTIPTNTTVTEDAAPSVGSDGGRSSSGSSSSTSSTESSSSSTSKTQKAYEVTVANEPETSETSGTTIIAIVGAIGMTSLVGVGYFKQNPEVFTNIINALKLLRRK